MLKMSQIIVSNKVVLLKMVKNKKKEGKITYKKKRKPRRIKLNLVNWSLRKRKSSMKFTVVSFVFAKNKNDGCGTTKNPTFNIWDLFINFSLSLK